MNRLYHINARGSVAAAPVEAPENLLRRLPTGFYTTFRTLQGKRKVVGLGEHLARLYEPAHQFGIPTPWDARQLRARLAAWLADYPAEEARVRLHLAKEGDLYVLLTPFTPLPSRLYEEGVPVITLPLLRKDPERKRSAFLRERARVLSQVRSAGAYEGLMTARGRIWEGLSSNFFYVQGEKLGTANRNVLRGVTRAVVLHLAREFHIPRRYRALPLDELDTIHEAFLCSSSRGLLPIVQIDGRPIGAGRPGALTRRLMTAYAAAQNRLAERIRPQP